MVVRLRLSRLRCRNKPFYRVMAADSRSPRNGKHLEVLGYYNPLPGQDGGKRMGIHFDRVEYWLSVGAQPSDPVQRLLLRAGLLPPQPVLAMGRKGGPCNMRLVDPMTGSVMIQGKQDSIESKEENPQLMTRVRPHNEPLNSYVFPCRFISNVWHWRDQLLKRGVI